MRRDIRDTGIYRRVEAFLQRSYRIGADAPFDLVDLAVAPDGRTVAASGLYLDRLEGLPEQRIVAVELETGTVTRLTEGPNRDRLPRWSPAGDRIAFLSDARTAYDFQLSILTVATGKIDRFPLEGRWVESLMWSPSGDTILLLAAGKGADLAGAQGAISTPAESDDAPPWAPHVDAGPAESHWRTLWLHDLASGQARQVSPPGMNVWEASWCGDGHVACIASDDPSEEAWYGADVRRLAIEDGSVVSLYRSSEQIGWISASASGDHIAFVEATCTDRMLVAGTLIVGERDEFTLVDSLGVDVTHTAWQGDDALLFAGLRGFETVLGLHHRQASTSEPVWACAERTFGSPLYPDVAPSPTVGHAVLMAEGHLAPPTLTVAAKGTAERAVATFDPVPPAIAHPGATLERFEWPAPDGMSIQGWLLRPAGDGPHPLVMDIHGGPVWRTRPRHVGRGGYAGMLLRAGFAVFQPNPRGSSGQGQAFARQVLGDAGGADAQDLLSGLDRLTELGIADPQRIGIVGGSYGGYMTAWLITQDARFAAAVAVAPVADWTSLRLTTHVPYSIEMLLDFDDAGPENRYLSRSPITHAHKVRTPTLIICGDLDRSTPPGQGVELHHALLRGGGDSVLLTYPGEGHGVRQFPAAIDYISRIAGWFEQHMPATAGGAAWPNQPPAA